jgi:serine/threonine protein phosphatase PrpC
MPFASMMLLVTEEEAIEALWFGDCAALIKLPDKPVVVLGDTLAKRELEAARVARLAAAHNISPAAGHNRPEFLPALRRARNTVNTREGGWLFGTDPRAADHLARRTLDVQRDSLVLLASDGFVALVSDYRAYDAEALVLAATSRGLAELGRQLREIEAADAEGQRYPRFKASDDATAVLLRLA